MSPLEPSTSVWHGRVWRLALPAILANLTIPLLGIVDTAVIGDLSPAHIGAIAVGATVFSLIHRALAFLRMARRGLMARADGASDRVAIALT